MRGDAQQREHKVVAARTHTATPARRRALSWRRELKRRHFQRTTSGPKGSKQRGDLGTLGLSCTSLAPKIPCLAF